MVEEKKKPDKAVPDQVVIGDDTVSATNYLDVLNVTSDFEAEVTCVEESRALAPTVSSLDVKIEPGVIIDDRYRLVYLAGNGATGQVWHAYDMHMGFGVAIKLISPKFQKDPDVLDRFRESFRVVHDLHHRYICPLNHMGNDERFGWYLVMQWMPETLSSFRQSLESRKINMSSAMIREIISMLAEGLDYVHELRVIHRDIKPANIVVSRNKTGDFNTVQLIDFGLSQDLDGTANDEMVACGTPAYMAPEQWTNSPQDGKTDQYALAMVAYELYCGHPAFSAPSYELMRASVLNDTPTPIPGLPPHVNQALLKALSKNREDRFASCTEFARALAPPRTFFERNLTGILSLTIIVLCVCLFSMFGFMHAPPMAETVLTYSQIERNLTFGKPGEKLSFMVIRDTHDESSEAMTDVIVSNNRKPQLVVDGLELNLAQPSSGKGWSCSALDNGNVVLTMNGYASGAIKASDLNLKLVLADGSKNVCTAKPGCVGLELHDGNLTVSGATAATGSLTVVCSDSSEESAKNSPYSWPVGVLVAGKGRLFTLERFASFRLQTGTDWDGILVENGDVNICQVDSVLIDCSKDRDAISADTMSVTASKSDSLDLHGGLCLYGPLLVFDSQKPDRRVSQLPFVFKICGITVDLLAGTQAELVEALGRVSIESPMVILLSDNIETSPRKGDRDFSVSTLSVARGHHILLSSGHRVIRKGPDHARDEELLFVKGRLSLGTPSGMGTSTILLDGGCKRTLDATEPITFSYNDGRSVEIARYRVADSSSVALVSVNGYLAMYDGTVVANNVNIRAETERNNDDFDFARGAGGIFVDRGGVFEMYGGRIQHCEAPFGGGVCVNGQFRLKEGTICENTGNNGNGSHSSEGAGVFVFNGKFEMSGGSISGNLALGNASAASGTGCAKGAGVHLSIKAHCKLVGGEICDNYSLWGGGGIYSGGLGTSRLEISDNIRIENNTAVVGGGIFMNAPVYLSGGIIAKNTLLKGPSATMPAGEGIYFLPLSNVSGAAYPCLFLSEKAFLAPDNHIFIASSNRSDAKERLQFDERFYPIIISAPLTGDPKSQHFFVDGGTFAFKVRNEIPLVGFRFTNANDRNILDKISARFTFGFLGVPDNKNFKFGLRTVEFIDVATGKAREEHCLSITSK